MNAINLIFKKRPRLLPIYLGALPVHRKGLKPGENFPAIASELKNGRIDTNHLTKFLKFFTIDESNPIPLSYPLSLVFPLHMPIIGHREFPILYVRMMQLRNHIIQHRPLKRTDIIDIKCRILTERRASKGIEMDVLSVITVEGKPVWENLNTYYFPGRFGDPDEPSPLSKMMPFPQNYTEQNFTISSKSAFTFSLLCGDYNGLHYNSPYARYMGFERSFAQSHMSLTNCLMHMPWFDSTEPIRMNVAYKGPVYYNRLLTMKQGNVEDGFRFDLYCEGNERPSIVGSLYKIKKNSEHNNFFQKFPTEKREVILNNL